MRVKILHGFKLKTTNTIMFPGQYVETEDPAQVEELQTFVEHGACEEVKSKEPEKKKPAVKNADPEATNAEDLSIIKGIGDATLKKLEAKNITTVSQLRAAVADAAREAEFKEVFTVNFDKIKEQLNKPDAK